MYRKAFTIIELLIAITIIMLLISAAGLQVNTTLKNRRDTTRLSDALLIARAIDQSAVVNSGRYPKNVINPANNSEMCANEIVSLDSNGQPLGNPSNPNNIDLTLFPKHRVPVDPQPLLPNPVNVGCTTLDRGYSYQTQYGNDVNSLAISQNVSYTIIIGLEREKSIDESTVRTPSELNITVPNSPGRLPYIINGSFCSSTSSEHCYQ